MSDGDHLVAPAPYLPFLDPAQARAPGLFPLDPKTWVERDRAELPQLRLRDALVSDHGDAVAAQQPLAIPAVGELVDLLAQHLETEHGLDRSLNRLVRADGDRIDLRGGVESLARLTQEDWLILVPDADGVPILQAGALCFPAGWALQDKIGRSLDGVHEPVPEYAEALSARLERIFRALHPDRPLQRFNFSVTGSPKLPCFDHADLYVHAPGGPYLRVERQTLRRLPEALAIAFGVKTYITPLSALTANERAVLADHYAALSPGYVLYRHRDAFPDALIRGT
ncbi:MAG: DUF3445 domain-containing protein [Pseudomonadota bacterium]